jgi:hypothetical protein
MRLVKREIKRRHQVEFFCCPEAGKKSHAIFESLILEFVTRLRVWKKKKGAEKPFFLKARRGMSGLGTVERK